MSLVRVYSEKNTNFEQSDSSMRLNNTSRLHQTFYLSWFSRYCGFVNCHVTPMRVLIGSESSRAIIVVIIVNLLVLFDKCQFQLSLNN